MLDPARPGCCSALWVRFVNMKARRVSQGFVLPAAAKCWWGKIPPRSSSMKARIIVIIPAGKEDPGGTPELCKRIGGVRRSEPWTIRVSRLLPEKTFCFRLPEIWVAGDLEGLSGTKEISEASAQINLTYVWHNVQKTDKSFQRKLETPSVRSSAWAAVSSWWCNLNWSSVDG